MCMCFFLYATDTILCTLLIEFRYFYSSLSQLNVFSISRTHCNTIEHIERNCVNCANIYTHSKRVRKKRVIT